MIDSCLVLIGSLQEIRKGETFGTGIIVKYKEQLYIVSCKHVYHEVKDKNSIFAIPRPKQTMNPHGGYALIYLDKPTFHPVDNSNKTYDIVAFKLLNNDERSLNFKNIIPLEINNYSLPLLSTNQELFAAGFPIEYINRLVTNKSEDNLPPKTVIGHEIEIDMSHLSQTGFTGELLEWFFIEKNDYTVEMGKGSSGGLIYRESGKEKIDPIGMILGEAKIEQTLPTNITRKINAIIFAQTKRIIETITNIK